ncbi:ROK family protein [Chthoniobacter flavus Ellin428]|uniref:ROK family protein n=1 Tax=Chthoniobacter flavus Ellin428 TaxID=497964 RepID=B4DBT4_9BACT|nr:ROK family protein [Chthoniobacter flavus]EDY16113.1 ROK family protein [Chthoniobacter flavus Ellin428]TCO83967.1 polyphosphate glucokinase [Chthoniobacter flavus]
MSKVLMIDVGGTSVKLMASGHEGFRKFPSGRTLTGAKMVKGVLAATEDWNYEVVTLGFPGIVRDGKVARNPLNLSGGWVDFDFEKAFKKPVRIINDAAMQALASYESGRMLFLGLGTSVGATLIVDDTIVPLEIGLIPLSKSEAFMDRLSKKALNTDGKRRWQRSVQRAVALLQDIFFPDVFQIGGGNAKYVDPLPDKCERGDNQDSFKGAIRMWPGADMLAEPLTTTWRLKRNGKPEKKKKK